MATKTSDKKQTKEAQVLAKAREVAASAKRWEDVHNAVFGIGGLMVRLFPAQSERIAFSKTPEFKAITDLIDELNPEDDEGEPAAVVSGKFVLRLPMSLHAALAKEAEVEGVSLNQLCVAKLAVALRATVK